MKWLPIILLFSWMTSCKTVNVFMEPKPDRTAAVDSLDFSFFYNDNYRYEIRKDDKITISVWGQDELSVGSTYGIYNSNEVYGKWLMVDADGNIEVPKVGTLNVLCMTTIELKDTLTVLFAKRVVDPIVDVKVLNKEIIVMGEVRVPQVVKVDKDNYTLMEMVSRCEGFAPYANVKYVKVLRQSGEHVVVANIDLSESGDYMYKNIQLIPGDIVIVPSKRYKEFDRRISVIIPFTTAITAAAILITAF
jgi:polysaccharide export outer membrane protein